MNPCVGLAIQKRRNSRAGLRARFLSVIVFSALALVGVPQVRSQDKKPQIETRVEALERKLSDIDLQKQFAELKQKINVAETPNPVTMVFLFALLYALLIVLALWSILTRWVEAKRSLKEAGLNAVLQALKLTDPAERPYFG